MSGVGTKVKICGLTRRRDALLAEEAGADYVGVVLVRSSPRCKSAEEARELLRDVRPSRVMVVADMEAREAAAAAETMEASVIQLHGNEAPHMVSALKAAGPWAVWKALRVRTEEDAKAGLDRYSDLVEGFVLDGWDPRKLGGTGRTVDWDGLLEFRRAYPANRDLVLAGGLRPENVRTAVSRLRPHIVDVSSGVEDEPGVKNRDRVFSFVENVRAMEWGEPR